MLKLIVLILFGGLTFSPSISMAQEIIFRNAVTGKVVTESDLEHAAGQFTWEIYWGAAPEKASKLHAKGREAGERGDQDAAISYFEQAAELAPDWPYPLYDAAFAYLLQKNYEKAYALYKRVDEMAPRGFFTAKTAIDILEKELKGELPEGMYLYYVSLEWEPDLRKQYEALTTLTTQFPSFAPAWKMRAGLEQNNEARLDVINRGLTAFPDPETKGFLLLNKAAVYANTGQKKEAVELLDSVIRDSTSTISVEALAKLSLAMLRKNK